MTEPPEHPRTPASRLLGAGARGAERLAGVTGVDRAMEDAMEEAIVRALRSPAVERAIVRVIERNAIQDALKEALTSDEIAEVVADGLDSETADRVWLEVLASKQAQMLVERVASAPEVRAAIAQQGVGLVGDIGRRLTLITERLDDALERIVGSRFRHRDEDEETVEAGLATRLVAAAVDFGVIAAIVSLISSLLNLLFSNDNASGSGLSATAVLGISGTAVLVGFFYFAGFWGLIGQTPGMRFLGIRVDLAGSRELGLRRATRRVLAVPIALLPFGLGFLAILRSPTRRGWHDRMSGTTVIYDRAHSTAPWATIEPVTRSSQAVHDSPP